MKPCNLSRNKAFNLTLVVVGLISLAFGIIWQRALPENSGNLDMLTGMLSGAGSALCALGAFWLVRVRWGSPEKLKQEIIDQNDERNIQIRRMAFTVSDYAATLIFALLAFVLLWLDYPTPALLCIGALYLHFIVFLIATRVLRRRI